MTPMPRSCAASTKARNLRDGHDLEQRYPDVLQVPEPFRRRPAGAVRREGAEMHLADDLTLEGHARPIPVPPFVSPGIDDLGGTMRPLRLEARDRIRIERLVGVEAE